MFALVRARTAHAIEVALDPPRIHADTVWVDVHLSELFDDRIEESISRGMPATLQLHAELWHRRTGWFDRLEDAVDAEIRVRYEVWNRSFRLERRGAPPGSYGTIDSLTLALSRPLALPVARLRPESRGGVDFVVVTATVRPLSVEDVAEVESWLSGEVESKRSSGFGLVTQVPRALFDAVRNFAGFGDDRGRAISSDFRVPRR
jgi:hypothetical protein